jgi:hypothetical protein
MKKITIILAGLLALNSAFGAGAERLKTGFGASVTASTTPTYIAIEQAPNTDIVSNGTFASTSYWITNTQWLVTGGKAQITNTANTEATLTNDMYQVMPAVVSGKKYRVDYTVANLSLTTNQVQVFVGGGEGEVRTVNGTYSDDISAMTDSNITFRVIGLDTNANNLTVDNVTVREVPALAYAYGAEVSVGPEDVPVYFGYSCSGDVFTNMYSGSRSMIVSSNRATIVEQGNALAPIRGFWYRTASGTATLRINAY